MNNKIRDIFSPFCLLLSLSSFVLAQQPPKLPPPAEETGWLWYVTLLFLVIGLAGAIVWKVKSKNKDTNTVEGNLKSQRKQNNADGMTFDADEEMEWLRKNQMIVDRKRKKKPSLNLPKTSEVLNQNLNDSLSNYRLEDLESVPLPIFNFQAIEPYKSFTPLPISNDEALISAIEQTQDEYEEDEEVRDLAVRILAMFKTKNAVEALSQVAIYDLSSNLRSKAVSVLTEFNHESVFEPILLACADPTREVRAAAARGLTRLSFDRADAWARIMDIKEEGRMRHAARAAIEGGFVERSYDRLVHRDPKHAYEAFVLLLMIVKSGETEQVFEAVRKHRDKKVRSALIHILKASKDSTARSLLYNLLEEKNLSVELRAEVDKAIAEMRMVAA
jgi:hypothetical protein